MDMAWVYILECSDGSFYVGSTSDLDARLAQHASGLGAKYTSRRLPVRLAWAEEFENIAEAYALEKKLQGWSHAKRLAVIEGRWSDLPGLSRSRRSEG
jgi:putative endonuclease